MMNFRILPLLLPAMLLCMPTDPARAQSPEPVAGRAFTLSYQPPAGMFERAPRLTAVYAFNFWGRRSGTRLALRANVLSPDTSRVHSVELTLQGRRWEGTISIPPNAALLSWYVTDGSAMDLNNDKTYLAMVRDSTGRIMPNAHFFMTPFVKLAGEPLDAQIAEAKEEILLYPENFRAYYQYYQLRLAWGRNGAGIRRIIADEIEALARKYGDSFEFRNLAARTYYYLLKDTKRGLAYRNSIPADKQYQEVMMMFDREEAEKRREEVTRKAESEQAVLLEKPAPPFELESYEGGKVQLHRYKGKVLLLGFWATWSKSCKEQIPALSRLAADLAPRGFAYVGMNLDGKRDVVKKFLETTPVKMEILFADPATAKKYGAGAIPHLVLVDKQGNVRKFFVGYSPGDEEKYRAAIEALLQGS